MKFWQQVLEEFALAREPMTWDLPRLRVTHVQKYEAVIYLREKGLLRNAGRLREEQCDDTYEITPTGRFVWQAGFTSLKRRKLPEKERPVVDPTLAERTVAIAHRDVFDLIRLPWKYSMKRERAREFGDMA